MDVFVIQCVKQNRFSLQGKANAMRLPMCRFKELTTEVYREDDEALWTIKTLYKGLWRRELGEEE